MTNITTWNILAPVFAECRYYKTQCKNLDIEERRPKIFEMIAFLNSDVYLLQEVQYSEFKHLRNFFRGYNGYFASHGRHHWARGKTIPRNGNAIFVRKNLLKGRVKKRRLLLSKNGNTALLLITPRTVFVSLHLDDEKRTLRVKQLTKLLEYLDSRFPKHSLVLGGDYNEHMRISDFEVDHSSPTYFEDNPVSIDHIYTQGFSPNRATIIPEIYPMTGTKVIELLGSDHIPITLAYQHRI